jgi:hypothetical protein
VPKRIAILGPNGKSLYVDFSRRMVIALDASYPKNISAVMLATLAGMGKAGCGDAVDWETLINQATKWTRHSEQMTGITDRSKRW